MPVAIKGTGNGSVTLDAGAAAADTTLTLPNTSGTILQSGTAVTAAQGGTGLTSPGTAGNVLTSTGSAWASSAPAATASLTLLATLTTTSGTTQSATGLATTYTNLVVVLEDCNDSTGATTGSQVYIEASVDNGSTYGTAVMMSIGTALPTYGFTIIFRANASTTTRARPAAASTASLLASSQALITTTSAAPINALRFSWGNAGSFTAGKIYVYGWN